MDLHRLEKEILRDPILFRLSKLSKEKDLPLFLVGGYLRDLILETHRQDYDFALPREAASSIGVIESVFPSRFFKVGKEELETTTYRIIKEEISADLTFFQGQTIETDLERRDFTINAIAFSLRDQTFHWVKGAFEDLDKKVLRSVSNRSIDQDPLRMLRAVRYVCTLEGFSLGETLRQEMTLKKGLISKLPAERIKMELDRILLSPRVATGMNLLNDLNLLLTLFPELRGLKDLGQNEHHHLNALSHTLLMMEKIPWAIEWVLAKGRTLSLAEADLLSLFYAALFHDIGKQETYSQDEKKRIHFYHHESFSSRAAEEIMERLRFSNSMRNKVIRLIQNHMRIHNLTQHAKETALKRLVHQMEEETPLLVLHTLADKEASRGILSLQIDEVVEAHCLRLLELYQQKEILHPPPLVKGEDVMALGYAPGPKVGEILNFIRGKQVEGEIRTREEAIELLKETFRLDS